VQFTGAASYQIAAPLKWQRRRELERRHCARRRVARAPLRDRYIMRNAPAQLTYPSPKWAHAIVVHQLVVRRLLNSAICTQAPLVRART
jgi:hypothetical protein